MDISMLAKFDNVASSSHVEFKYHHASLTDANMLVNMSATFFVPVMAPTFTCTSDTLS